MGLASAVAYGASDFVGGVGARRASSLQIALVGQTAGALALLAYAAVLPGSPIPSDFGWAALAGVGSASGSIFLLRGFARGRMGVVAPVSAVGAAALPVLAGTALGDRPGWISWTGMLVALPGIWLVSRETSSPATSGSRGAFVDGALAGAGFGLLFIALAQLSDDAGPLPLAADQAIGALLTAATGLALRQPWRPGRRAIGWGSASGVLGAGGTLAFALAAGASELGIVAVLASLYPAVTVLLAAALLGERIRLAQRIGIGICTLAVATLALG
nr:DMT family transporter [Agromyces seonyuensis]